MAIRLEAKRPDEVIDYEIKWDDFLGTDTISTSTVTADGVSVSSSHTDTIVSLEISGGDEGALAKITNTIETAGGRKETEVFTLFISAGEPVSLAELKEHLGVLSSDWDAQIAAYGRAAREFCEKYSDHILVRRQITEHRARFKDLFIWKRPLVSIDSVGYTDEDGNEQSIVDAWAEVWRWPVAVSPSTSWPTANSGVSVTYTAGYAEGEVPETFIQAIKLLVGHWFETRSTVANETRTVPHEVPFAVKALLERDSAPIV